MRLAYYKNGGTRISLTYKFHELHTCRSFHAQFG